MRELIREELGGWKTMAYHHWKEHCPNMFKRLLKAGKLPQALEEAANQTAMEMDQMMDAGFTHHQAWEATRENYLFLRQEEGLEDEDEETTSPGWEILKEMIELHRRIGEYEDEKLTVHRQAPTT